MDDNGDPIQRYALPTAIGAEELASVLLHHITPRRLQTILEAHFYSRNSYPVFQTTKKSVF